VPDNHHQFPSLLETSPKERDRDYVERGMIALQKVIREGGGDVKDCGKVTGRTG
jgi:hypothetical protein